MRESLIIFLLAWIALLPGLAAAQRAAPDEKPILFTRDIAPILLKNCQECHGPGKSKGKFRLDSFSRLTKPGDSNHPSITPGHPDQSEVFRLISTADEDDRMPKKSDRLPEPQVQLIKQWIERGALFDGTDVAAPLASIVPRQLEPGPPERYAQPVPITALAFNPEGSVLAASGYHEITLWDSAAGRLLSRIRNLPERIGSLAFSPDGRLLAVACGNPASSGELRLYTMSDPPVPETLERIADMMLVVRFSPDGSLLATGGADNAIRIYDVATRQRRQFIEQHADWVTDLAFSPDGKRLASASRDKSARVFDVATGAMDGAYLGHTEAVLAIAWSPDGSQIFTAGQDRAIHAWNPNNPDKVLGKIPVLEGDVYKLDASRGVLLACTTDHALRTYALKKRALVGTVATADWPYSLAIDPASHRIAVGNYNGQIQLFTSDSKTPRLTFTAAPGRPR